MRLASACLAQTHAAILPVIGAASDEVRREERQREGNREKERVGKEKQEMGRDEKESDFQVKFD